jgi:hypothetical protein
MTATSGGCLATELGLELDSVPQVFHFRSATYRPPILTEGVPKIGAGRSFPNKGITDQYHKVNLQKHNQEIIFEGFDSLRYWEQPGKPAFTRIWDDHLYEEYRKEFNDEGIHKVPQNCVKHIRQPLQVSTFGQMMLNQLDQKPDRENTIIVGIDTEGGKVSPATCQLSTKQGRQELHHIYQLRSEKDSHGLEKLGKSQKISN